MKLWQNIPTLHRHHYQPGDECTLSYIILIFNSFLIYLSIFSPVGQTETIECQILLRFASSPFMTIFIHVCWFRKLVIPTSFSTSHYLFHHSLFRQSWHMSESAEHVLFFITPILSFAPSIFLSSIFPMQSISLTPQMIRNARVPISTAFISLSSSFFPTQLFPKIK